MNKTHLFVFVGLFFFTESLSAQFVSFSDPGLSRREEQERIQREIEAAFPMEFVKKLASGEKNLKEWAEELERSTPETSAEIWVVYHVCLRAGHYEKAKEMLPKLYEVIEPKKEFAAKIYEIYHPLRPKEDGDRLLPEIFELQVRFFEVFGRLYGTPNFGASFREACPWNQKELTGWVRDRFFAAMEYDVERSVDTSKLLFHHTNSIDILSKVGRGWQNNYFVQLRNDASARLRQKEIRREQYLDSLRDEWHRLAERAKNDPDNLKKLLYFLRAVERLGFAPDAEGKEPDVDWFARNAEKRSGLEANLLAKQLVRSVDPHPIFNDKKNRDKRRAVYQKEIDRIQSTINEVEKNTPLNNDELARLRDEREKWENHNTIQTACFSLDNFRLGHRAAEPLWRRALADEPPRTAFNLPKRLYHLRIGEDEQALLEKMYQNAREDYSLRILQNLIQTLSVLGHEEEARKLTEEGRRRYRAASFSASPSASSELSLFIEPPSDEKPSPVAAMTGGSDPRLSTAKDYDSMLRLLKEEKKYDEMIALFRKHEKAVQVKPEEHFRILQKSALVFVDTPKKAEVFDLHREEMRRRLENLKKPDCKRTEELNYLGRTLDTLLISGNDRNNYRQMMDLKEPIYREILDIIPVDGTVFPRLAELFLYPKGNTIGRDVEKPNPGAIEMLKERANRPDIDTTFFIYVNQILCRHNGYADAVPFLEKAIAVAEVRDPGRVHTFKQSMVSAARGAGDWRRLEKFADELFNSNTDFLDSYLERLQQAAESAEKQGENEEAVRIRKRIAQFDARK